MSNPAISTLAAAGTLLHGSDWQSPLARDLGVDGRTMRFWVSETRPVPPAILTRLPEVLRAAARVRRQDAVHLERMADTL